MIGRRTLVGALSLLAVGAVCVVAYVFGGQQTLSGLTSSACRPIKRPRRCRATLFTRSTTVPLSS